MEIKISTRHGQLGEDAQATIYEKVSKLANMFERLMEIEVTVDLADATHPRVDLRVEAEHKHDFVAHHQSDDLLGTVDQALHKMEQQVRKYKEKIQNHHRTPASGDQH